MRHQLEQRTQRAEVIDLTSAGTSRRFAFVAPTAALVAQVPARRIPALTTADAAAARRRDLLGLWADHLA